MHPLRPAIDVNRMRVITAVRRATFIRFARNDVAIVACVRIAPLPRDTRMAVLESIVFGFLRVSPIALIQALADLASDNAADHGTADCRKYIATAFADLIADDTSSDTAQNHACAGVVDPSLAVAAGGEQRTHHQRNR